MQGEASPTGADFQQVIVGLQLQFTTGAIELLNRRRAQRRIRRREDAAGVGPRFIEPESEELVAQVVMGLNVLAASAGRIGSEPMHDALQGHREFRQSAVELICGGEVANKKTKERSQITAIPVPLNVRLGDRERAAEHRLAKEPRVTDVDPRMKVACSSESLTAVCVAHVQFAAAQSGQATIERPPRRAIEPRQRGRSFRIVVLRANHGAASSRTGASTC